jgi:hypothetical protein
MPTPDTSNANIARVLRRAEFFFRDPNGIAAELRALADALDAAPTVTPPDDVPWNTRVACGALATGLVPIQVHNAMVADFRAFCYARDVADAYAEAALRGDRTPKAPETPPTPRNRLSGANSPKDDQP